MPAGRSPSAEALSADKLARILSEYLELHPSAAVLEDGRVLFDLRTAKYAVDDSHGRCVLQFWSEERNVVRTVVEIQQRAASLRVMTRRMGAPKPTALEIIAAIDRRTPTTRDSERRNYMHLLERVLTRQFPGAKVEAMRSAMDLEHSFGPAYARGRLVRGTSAEAIIGVGPAESAATIDGILTLGLLWLDYCREHGDIRRHFGGLKVVVPEGASRTTSERMAWLSPGLANFELYTLDSRTECLRAVDLRDTGNLESRLVQAFSPQAAIDACAPGLQRAFDLLPEDGREKVEVMARSATQVAFLLYGLEFARVQLGAATTSFARGVEVVIGTGASETLLTGESAGFCRDMLAQLFANRHPGGSFNDPLFRLQPERWLESRLRAQLADVLPGVRADMIYAQVPALSSTERGMLDLLSVDRDGRLIVIELKANEDLHLPVQALDYWIRVRALLMDRQHRTSGREVSAFERRGYFPGVELSQLPPRLFLAAPALRIHPANEPILRYLSPEISWELAGLSENWRCDLSVIFRKRTQAASPR
jgi:hypothetical protein